MKSESSREPKLQNAGSRDATAPACVAECRRRLLSPDPRRRREAAESLHHLGPEAEPLLRRALVDTEWQVRAAALRSLPALPELQTQALLLELLRSDYPEVRAYAAQVLGEVGDERALLPLIEAYECCFTGRSARRQRMLVPVLLISTGVVVGTSVSQWLEGRYPPHDIFMTALLCFSTFTGLRSRRPPWRVFLQAILQIGERNPRPELYRLLPDLQSLAADRVQIYPDDREAARVAAERIREWSAAIQDLPLPASAASAGPEALPVPAEVGGDTARVQRCGGEATS